MEQLELNQIKYTTIRNRFLAAMKDARTDNPSTSRLERRCLHLVLSMMRGTPYKKVESICNTGERPTGCTISRIVKGLTKEVVSHEAITNWIIGV